MHARQDRWEDDSLPITEVGFCVESQQKPVQTHTGVHSAGPYVQHQGDANLITHG